MGSCSINRRRQISLLCIVGRLGGMLPPCFPDDRWSAQWLRARTLETKKQFEEIFPDRCLSIFASDLQLSVQDCEENKFLAMANKTGILSYKESPFHCICQRGVY